MPQPVGDSLAGRALQGPRYPADLPPSQGEDALRQDAILGRVPSGQTILILWRYFLL